MVSNRREGVANSSGGKNKEGKMIDKAFSTSDANDVVACFVVSLLVPESLKNLCRHHIECVFFLLLLLLL